MPQPILNKRDTAAAWAAANTVLAAAQFGVETDTGKAKVGVAAGTAWSLLPYIEGASGLSNLPGRSPMGAWVPIVNSTTIGVIGSGATGTSIIDGSAPVVEPGAATSLMTTLPHVRYGSGTGTPNRMAGLSVEANLTSLLAPTASIKSGFKMRIAAAINDAGAGQFGIGCGPTLEAGSWTSSVAPSSMLNCVFLGADTADAQLTVMHNGSSGSCTKIALNGGVGFPNNTSFADLYEFTIDFSSNGSARTLAWTAANLATGLSVSGTIPDTSKIPVAGTPVPEFFARGNGAASTACSLQFYGKQIGVFA